MVQNTIEQGVATAAGICGILLGIFGLGDAICGFVWVGYGGGGGHGIWSGFGLILCCIVGVLAWRRTDKTFLILFMIGNIIMLIVAAVQAGLAAIVYVIWNILLAAADCRVTFNRCHCGSGNVPLDLQSCDAIRMIDNLWLALLVMSAMAAVVCLAGSIIGCVGSCCATPQQPGAVIVTQPMGAQPNVVVYPGAYPAGAQPGYPPGQQYPQQGGQYPIAQHPQGAQYGQAQQPPVYAQEAGPTPQKT